MTARRRTKHRRPEPCHVCGFEDTRGRCRDCGRPVCEGCSEFGSRPRRCPCGTHLERVLQQGFKADQGRKS